MQSHIVLGNADTRRGPRAFSISPSDRLNHQYVIGQTGTGKSTLLANMAVQDATFGNGFCLIDPHGDLADELSELITAPHIHWRVGDPDCPYGYNPLTKCPKRAALWLRLVLSKPSRSSGATVGGRAWSTCSVRPSLLCSINPQPLWPTLSGSMSTRAFARPL